MLVDVYAGGLGQKKSIPLSTITKIEITRICGLWRVMTNQGLIGYYKTRGEAQREFDRLITAFRGKKRPRRSKNGK